MTRFRDQVERDSERPRGMAAAIAAQRAADGFDVGAELQRDAACDRRVRAAVSAWLPPL